MEYANQKWYGEELKAWLYSRRSRIPQVQEKMMSSKISCALLCLLAPVGTTLAAVVCVSPGGVGGCSSSIQAGINSANPGDTVRIKRGTYIENVMVTKSVTLAGDDQEKVIVMPSVSGPVCSGGSLCTGSSSIILVQADNVTIQNMTLDGDNPNLHSGVVAGGADLDARNGIITNHLVGTFNNLVVHDVTVKNIYLRGIYASSGGSFNFHNNSVSNVQADPASICMFNFVGSGVMQHNKASACNDALSSNHSSGVQFLDNEITNSGSGVHTDNAGDGGLVAPELIRGNTVSHSMPGGFGIFTFVPYVPITVDSNSVQDADVGLAAYGQGAPAGVTTFNNNAVDLSKRQNSVGAFVTTNILGFGATPVSALFTANEITKAADGFLLSNDQSSLPLDLTATCNRVSNNAHSGVSLAGTNTLTFPPIGGNGVYSVALHSNNLHGNGLGVNNTATTTTVDAANNWWGCSHGPGAPGCDATFGNVNFVPFLADPPKCSVGNND